jgi:predicted HicB family RNase H-like nuclease
LEKYYTDRNFEILFKQDLSHTLKDFYKMSANLLENKVNDLTEQEKSYHKKFLNRLSHESNAYLKLGGNDFMGFKMLISKAAK